MPAVSTTASVSSSSSSGPASASGSRALNHCLVLWPVAPALLSSLKGVFHRVSYFPIQGPDAAPDAPRPTAADYASADAIFAFAMPQELQHPRQTPNLRLWQCCAAGVSHLQETAFFKAQGPESRIVWANATGIQTSTIGEHVLGTVLMLTHKIHYLYLAQQTQQRWVPHKELGGNFIRELKSLTVGLVGYGNIARETARLFSACGATVLALTRSGRPEPFPSSSLTLPSTGDPSGSVPTAYFSSQSRDARLAFFARCDVVVNTLPDSKATRGCMGREELSGMKGDAIYVNVGRGTTTDQEALVEALRARAGEGEERDAVGTLRIGAASLDVTDPEPLPSSSPLWTLPNCIVTPHMSALSSEYWQRALGVLALNAARLADGDEGVNVFRAPKVGA